MIDFKVDGDLLGEQIASIENINSKMESACASMSSLVTNISEGEYWLGNGQKECAAFMSLVETYLALVTGKNGIPLSEYSASYNSDKVLKGNNAHMDMLLKEMKDFYEEMQHFEFNDPEPTSAIKEIKKIDY